MKILFYIIPAVVVVIIILAVIISIILKKNKKNVKIKLNDELVNFFTQNLGGKENIKSVTGEHKRIVFLVNDLEKCNLQAVKENQDITGVFITGNNVKISVSEKVNNVSELVKKLSTK